MRLPGYSWGWWDWGTGKWLQDTGSSCHQGGRCELGRSGTFPLILCCSKYGPDIGLIPNLQKGMESPTLWEELGWGQEEIEQIPSIAGEVGQEFTEKEPWEARGQVPCDCLDDLRKAVPLLWTSVSSSVKRGGWTKCPSSHAGTMCCESTAMCTGLFPGHSL